MGRYSVRIGMTLDQMLGELSEAAWLTVKANVPGKQGDRVRSEIQDALRDVMRRDLVWSDICGLAVVCTDATQSEPWSSGDEGCRSGGRPVDEKIYDTARCGERD